MSPMALQRASIVRAPMHLRWALSLAKAAPSARCGGRWLVPHLLHIVLHRHHGAPHIA
jgi:hypothetical protein